MKKKIIFAAIAAGMMMFCAGCFSAMKKGLGGIDGGDSSIGVTEILLDAVTLPAQIVLFGPPLIYEMIDASTGERGAKERAAKKWWKAKREARNTLERDYDSIFADGRYFSATNTPQREMLVDWLCWYNISQLTTQQVVRTVGKIMEEPSLLRPLAPICMRGGMTAEQREWCMDEALNLATNEVAASGDRVHAPLYWMLQNPTVDDDEFCRIAAMNIKGCDMDYLMKCRLYKRRDEVVHLLVKTLGDDNSAFLDKPDSLSYKALKDALEYYLREHLDNPKSIEYLFARMERDPKLIDECLELYGVERGVSPKRQRRNLEFALERAAVAQDARILLKVLCLDGTPQEYKDAALANPRLEYCRKDIAKVLGVPIEDMK
ncbi:MAG: hypothetical protein IJU44_10865 [Kiritimatiellae bacterium]|nr:hypothetical protein [Kiritimatiellia bacterium]